MFEQLLADLARALDAEHIPYMVIGGQAVLLYGEPRLTRDIDLTLARTPDDLGAVLRVAERLGLVPLVEPETFVPATFVLPCEQPGTGLRVDFVFSSSAYERQAMARTRPVVLGGVTVRFASREDLLVQKLVAGRPRDLEDARSVLLRHPDTDVAYVRQWLQAFSDALDADFEARFVQLLAQTRDP
jgi:hypothetical protein